MSPCREIKRFNHRKICGFCRSKEAPADESLGKIYECEGITTHYYCLLFASGLLQNGQDDEGILGFFPKDIRREFRRANKLTCHYCNGRGAAAKCYYGGCNIKFHVPCGIRNNSLHQFFGSFKSFCRIHRSQQTIPQQHLEDVNLPPECVICYDRVLSKQEYDVLWAPCCKTAWLHRPCVQKMALNWAAYFRCPKCNNQQEFLEEMRQLGIYIPHQDASWNMAPDLDNESERRYSACDAKKCACEEGRNYSTKKGRWRIILCELCASHGTHRKCRGSRAKDRAWVCELCSKVNDAIEKSRKAINEATAVSFHSDDDVNSAVEDENDADERLDTRSPVAQKTTTSEPMDDNVTEECHSNTVNDLLIDLSDGDSDDETTNKKPKLEITSSDDSILMVEDDDDDDDIVFVGHKPGEPKRTKDNVTSVARIRFCENGKTVEMSATSVKREAGAGNANGLVWRSVPIESSILRRQYREQSFQTPISTDSATNVADKFTAPCDIIVIDD